MRPADLGSEQTFPDADRISHGKAFNRVLPTPRALEFCSHSQLCPGISFPIRKLFTVSDVGDEMQPLLVNLLIRTKQIQQTIVTGGDLKGSREAIMISLHLHIYLCAHFKSVDNIRWL